jgi:hypothetical protein
VLLLLQTRERGRRGRDRMLVAFVTTLCASQVCFGFMVFNATFNNILVILWRSVLLEDPEETGVPGENHRPVAS